MFRVPASEPLFLQAFTRAEPGCFFDFTYFRQSGLALTSERVKRRVGNGLAVFLSTLLLAVNWS